MKYIIKIYKFVMDIHSDFMDSKLVVLVIFKYLLHINFDKYVRKCI